MQTVTVSHEQQSTARSTAPLAPRHNRFSTEGNEDNRAARKTPPFPLFPLVASVRAEIAKNNNLPSALLVLRHSFVISISAFGIPLSLPTSESPMPPSPIKILSGLCLDFGREIWYIYVHTNTTRAARANKPASRPSFIEKSFVARNLHSAIFNLQPSLGRSPKTPNPRP